MANEEFLHTNLLYRLVDRLMVSADVLLARVVTVLDDPGTLTIMLLGIALSCALFAWAFGTLFLHLNRRQPGPGRARGARRATVQPARPAPPGRATRPAPAPGSAKPAGASKRRRRAGAPR